MNQLYPLKFKPILKDKIWGGSKLKNILKKEGASESAGESWEISGVENNISVVSNGFLKGNDLQELIEIYMGDLVGQKVFEQFGTDFPLLIKFIDAADDLSIQVHPNDEQALERHNSFGKTEMWYLMQTDPNAELIVGFNQAVDKDLYLKKFNENKVLEILNNISVKADDVFFIPAGRIHTIGKGCLLAEIQQKSDITYRIYDFNRKDSDGKFRELHTEQAIDAIDYSFEKEYKTNYSIKNNGSSNLANCKYFTTNLIELDDALERDMIHFDSFIIYMCLEGSAKLCRENEKDISIIKGETILVPAEISHYYLKTSNKAKLLEVYIGNTKHEN